MKKIKIKIRTSAMLLCILCYAGYTQAQDVFSARIILPSNSEQETLSKVFKKQTLVNFDVANFHSFVRQHPELSLFRLKVGNLYDWNIELRENEMRSPDYRHQVTYDYGTVEMPRTECITYAGNLVNTTENYVRLNIEANRFSANITDDGKAYYIEPLKNFISGANMNSLVIYGSGDVIPKVGTCGRTETISEKVEDKANNMEQQKNSLTGNDCRKIEIATETDWEAYDDGVSTSDILGNLNLVEPLYQNSFSAAFIIRYQHEWGTSADPYTSLDACATPCVITSNNRLGEYVLYWQANFAWVQRDINVLYTRVDFNNNTIGCATCVGAFQNAPLENYCVNMWDWCGPFCFTSDAERQALVAHEVGHLFNASHVTSGCGSGAGPIMCTPITDACTNNCTPYWGSASTTAIEACMNNAIGRTRLRTRYYNEAVNWFLGFPFVVSGNDLFSAGALTSGTNSPIYIVATDTVTLQPGFSAVVTAANTSINVSIGACDINGGRNGSAQQQIAYSSVHNSIQAYPNPFNNNFNLDINLVEDATVSVTIYDMMGKEVDRVMQNQTKQKGLMQLQYSNEKLPPNIYMCVIEINGKRYTEKIVKL